MRIVALIPARGGSQRLPNKNLRPLGDRPLLAYTCEAARGAGVCSAVYLNTDSPRIAAVAAQYGVACPVLRPAYLAQDDTPTRAANLFLLEHLRAVGETFDAVMVLQPTSPLRRADDIRAAAALWREHPDAAVISVTAVAPASWCGVRDTTGQLRSLAGGELLFRRNGAIYIYPYADYLEQREPSRVLAFEMPASRGVDIDTPEDLIHAEFLLEQQFRADAG